MLRFAQVLVLATFFSGGLGIRMVFAAEPAPADQTDKKDRIGSKADDQKTDVKADATGKYATLCR
ncbi:hypothetical protein ACO9S2_13210 [Nitrospira sp. NS4]|uniref:hypothetical protein n=1 Tax=Nitrospira sp. NS4 TaxID=3414498 RepID=UPI003C2D9B37